MSELLCAKCGTYIQGQAVQGPAGWLHPSCAPGSGWKVPLLVALGCAVPAGFVVLVMVFLAIWQFLSPAAPPAAAMGAGDAGAAAVSTALTQRYESANGLLVAHYPASFAASRQGDAAVVVARPLPGGDSETVLFEIVAQPISTDLEEIERLITAAEAKQLDRYVVTSSRPGTCGGRAGFEVIGSFVAANGVTYDRRACRFYDGGRYCSIVYQLPHATAAAEAPLLESIVAATEVRPSAPRPADAGR
jgi:hypothetical protein